MTEWPKLDLPTVTLCAATSVNLPATVQALQQCLDQARFADCILFTDERFDLNSADIRVERIKRLRSAQDYSAFMLKGLADYIESDHVLVVQWDGFILDASCWQDRFLEFDYIGATWPQFRDEHDVGNGGFSLRSRRLLEACRDPFISSAGIEDVTICRTYRAWLEREHGIRFAPREIAESFAYEREPPQGPTFGFHGVFNMIPVLGHENFWRIYKDLDERSSIQVDYGLLLRQLRGSPGASKRQLQLTLDRVRHLLGR